MASAKKKARKPVPVGDRVTVYLALAQAYLALDKPEEADKTMTEAKMEFQGTREEVRCVMWRGGMQDYIHTSRCWLADSHCWNRVTIADAEMAVKNGKVEAAITALRCVTPDMPYFVQVPHPES